jgi:hypothetical protein
MKLDLHHKLPREMEMNKIIRSYLFKMIKCSKSKIIKLKLQIIKLGIKIKKLNNNK